VLILVAVAGWPLVKIVQLSLQEQESGLMESLLRKAAALGLLGLEIPEEFGGLGLAIIDAISDELAIDKRTGGGSKLRFVKHLS